MKILDVVARITICFDLSIEILMFFAVSTPPNTGHVNDQRGILFQIIYPRLIEKQAGWVNAIFGILPIYRQEIVDALLKLRNQFWRHWDHRQIVGLESLTSLDTDSFVGEAQVALALLKGLVS